MASEHEQTPDPAVDRYAYSRAGLARLVLSYELQELAERAMSGVPTVNDMWSHPGEEVSDALSLVAQAQEVLTRAVIYERAKGTSWEAIAEQMQMKRQSAHERFRGAEQEWKDSQHEPFYPAPPGRPAGLRLHPAAYEAVATGRRLDEWTRDHLGDRTHLRGDEHPVTGHLRPLSVAEEMVQVLDAITYATRTGAGPAFRAVMHDRKAALLDRIAVEDGKPEAAVQAAESRARAAELRAEAAE